MNVKTQYSLSVFTEQVRLLYADALVILLASLAAGILLCWSQWSVIDHALIVAWFAVFFQFQVVELFSSTSTIKKTRAWKPSTPGTQFI